MSTIAMLSEVPPRPVPPQPAPSPHMPEVHVHTPLVYVEPAWEYRHITRDVAAEDELSDAELTALGADGWELVGIYGDQRSVHFYFKRQTR